MLGAEELTVARSSRVVRHAIALTTAALLAGCGGGPVSPTVGTVPGTRCPRTRSLGAGRRNGRPCPRRVPGLRRPARLARLQRLYGGPRQLPVLREVRRPDRCTRSGAGPAKPGERRRLLRRTHRVGAAGGGVPQDQQGTPTARVRARSGDPAPDRGFESPRRAGLCEPTATRVVSRRSLRSLLNHRGRAVVSAPAA